MEIISKLRDLKNNKNVIYATMASSLLAMNSYDNLKIKDLQSICHVSSTTVMRFCKVLGYTGFSELKFLLCQASEKNKKIIVKDNLALSSKANEHLNGIALSFVETRDLLTDKKLKGVVNDIISAKFISVYAIGSTFLVARDLEWKLDRIGIRCKSYQDLNLQYFAAKNTKNHDLAVGLSYSGTSKQVIESLHIAKEKGAKTLLITNENNTQFENEFTHVLYVSSTDEPGRLITTTSRLTMLYIIDLIYFQIISSDREKMNQILLDNKLDI